VIPILEDLSGKVIIITGGNKGIGAGCAEAFCACGCRVVIAGRDAPRGEHLAAELNAKGPGTCTFRSCDVSRDEQVQDLVARTVREHGGLDCCINNAGYLPRRRGIDDITAADFEHVLRTNLLGVFSGCKHSLPHLRVTRGSLINMSSILGRVGQEGSSIYAATKGAIISLTKSLAIDEARHGVRVNAVLPGNILSELGMDTGGSAPEDEQSRRVSRKIQWIRRQGTPVEIGWTCVYLASGMASYVTGAEICATGGFELGNGIRLTREELAKITLTGD
jgi:NAD(P)-dependent dehydrogenase (short-subunit alcohol dehydrogenase family)